MADLRTDYVDDILDTSTNERRKYRMITNDDGTVSFVDVTDYSQIGDSFGSNDLNAITNAVNENTSSVEQINVDLATKQPIITGGASTITTNNLIAGRVLATDADGKVANTGITINELACLYGVTGSIQNQIDSKQNNLGFLATTMKTQVLQPNTDYKIHLESPVATWRCVFLLGWAPAVTNADTFLQIRNVIQNNAQVDLRYVGSTAQAFVLNALWIW